MRQGETYLLLSFQNRISLFKVGAEWLALVCWLQRYPECSIALA